MEDRDLMLLCCPDCRSDLINNSDFLKCSGCGSSFPIVNGIPRLLPKNISENYNKMWDFKWKVLDDYHGYNYQIIEKESIAYKIHNVFRFFEEDGSAFKDIKENSVAIDIGCGIGQYSISLLGQGVGRVFAVDLTGGVDVGKKIIEEKYPQYRNRIIFVQADARNLPFKSNTMDISMALASIHHTGDTKRCVEEIRRITKPSRRFFCWVYAQPSIPFGDKYRKNFFGWFILCGYLFHMCYIEFLFNIFKRLPNSALVFILRMMSADWIYRLKVSNKVMLYVVTFFLPGINRHPEKGYRLINLYDAYSPAFSEAHSENEIIMWGREMKYKIISFTPNRLGFICEKESEN